MIEIHILKKEHTNNVFEAHEKYFSMLRHSNVRMFIADEKLPPEIPGGIAVVSISRHYKRRFGR